MKRIALSAFACFALICPIGALAQTPAPMASHNAMSHSAMSHSAMKHTAMKHSAMSHTAMSHAGPSAMSHSTMMTHASPKP